MDEEIERIRAEAITQREFDRVVTQKESGFIWGLEGLLSRANLLQSYNHYKGNPDFITSDLDRFRKSSVDKVRDVASKYLVKERRVEVLTLPANRKGASK
jgi:predicted Zn-dependent peptidase